DAGNGAGAEGGMGRTAGDPADAGAVPADLATEQMLRNGGDLSISLDGERGAQPQISVLPVFTDDGTPVGRFRVDDLGDSLALHPVASGDATVPSLQQGVRARAQTRVKVDEERTALL